MLLPQEGEGFRREPVSRIPGKELKVKVHITSGILGMSSSNYEKVILLTKRVVRKRPIIEISGQYTNMQIMHVSYLACGWAPTSLLVAAAVVEGPLVLLT